MKTMTSRSRPVNFDDVMIDIETISTLPESVRIPLNSLQADLGYLIGRVVADGSCGPMIIQSMLDRLDQIEFEVSNTRVSDHG